MTNIDRLRATYNELARQESKLVSRYYDLIGQLNKAAEKKTTAQRAVDTARTEADKTKAEATLREAAKAAEKIHARLVTVSRRELPKVSAKSVEAMHAMHAAEDAERKKNGTTTRTTTTRTTNRSSGTYGIQGHTVTNTTVVINGRTVYRR